MITIEQISMIPYTPSYHIGQINNESYLIIQERIYGHILIYSICFVNSLYYESYVSKSKIDLLNPHRNP